MGFYGNIYYQLVNTFHKIFVRNNGKNANGFADSAKLVDYEVEAQGRKGVIELDAGNKWIQLTGNGDRASFEIYHGPADTGANNSFSSFEKVENADSATVFKPGDSFKVSSVKYDDAGHVGSVVESVFTLEKTEVENFNDRITANTEAIDTLTDSVALGQTFDTEIDERVTDLEERLKGVDFQAIITELDGVDVQEIAQKLDGIDLQAIAEELDGVDVQAISTQVGDFNWENFQLEYEDVVGTPEEIEGFRAIDSLSGASLAKSIGVLNRDITQIASDKNNISRMIDDLYSKIENLTARIEALEGSSTTE